MTKQISAIFGVIANTNFGFFQPFINKFYIKLFDIDMSEFKPFGEYKTLNELFTRKLIKKRKFCENKNDFISPSDGVCLYQGRTNNQIALSIKDRMYKVSDLLGVLKGQGEYEFFNIYLSPKNYHCYHCPCDMQILSALHIPGNLKSVNLRAINKFINLYETNERVILQCKNENNIFWLVFVGALNVGKIKFVFDERINTNAKNSKNSLYKYENLFIKKGELLGNFELGSTILIFFEKDTINFLQKQDCEIKFGETIGFLSSDRN